MKKKACKLLLEEIALHFNAYTCGHPLYLSIFTLRSGRHSVERTMIGYIEKKKQKIKT